MSPGPYLNQGAFKTTISANDATPQEELGIWRFEAGKIYKYVKVTSSATSPIMAGAAVKSDSNFATQTAALAGNQVVFSSGVTNLVLGIAETTLAAANYGWLTCYGPATAMVVSNVIPDSLLGPSASTGVLGIIGSTSNIVGLNPMGITIQTGLSAGSAVFVSAL